MSRKGRNKKKDRKRHATPSLPSSTNDVGKCNDPDPRTKKELAAQLLAEDHITETEIAETIGVTSVTLWRWKQEPEFQASVAEVQKHILNLSRRYLIARKSYRLANLQRRLLAMEQIIRERGVDAALQKAAGGKTGWLIRRQRVLGSGENAVLVEEFEFDAALERAMRETEKQAAQECGDWTEKKEIGGVGGGPLILQIIEEVVEDNDPPEANTTPPSSEAISH